MSRPERVGAARRRGEARGGERGERDIDDPTRLADEARQNVERAAVELRRQRVTISTEPPTVYRP